MATFDLLIKGGTVVFPDGEKPCDIGVSAGKVVELGSVSGSATTTIDASGTHVFPGMIDPHVHFNQPGRTEWETLKDGSSALAKGGGTAFFDMPLNSEPFVLDAASFKGKLAEAQKDSLVDFAFYGGLTPDNLDHLEEMADLGAVAFKAFNCFSGLKDYRNVDDWAIYKGMQTAARLGLPVCVHCENDQITTHLTEEAMAAGKTSARAFLDSRPAMAETESIQRMIAFAEDTGCHLHVCHVSTARGVELVTEAKARGVSVTCETLPNYLVLTDEDVIRIGTMAKCCPPPRDAANKEALWKRVRNHEVAMVASDHSPGTRALKQADNFFKAWGGISGVQTTLNAMLTEGHHQRKMALHEIADLTARHPAEVFRIAGKGKIAVGYDADFSIIDLNRSFTLTEEDLLYKNKISAFVGTKYQGTVLQTILRGHTVYRNGEIVSKPIGQLLKPTRANHARTTR